MWVWNAPVEYPISIRKVRDPEYEPRFVVEITVRDIKGKTLVRVADFFPYWGAGYLVGKEPIVRKVARNVGRLAEQAIYQADHVLTGEQPLPKQAVKPRKIE